MPRRNALRDSVAAVRSQLSDLSNLSREQIELALLYYESNIDETVQAFRRNGAIEALSGWTQMNNNRNSTKRANNKSVNQDNKFSPSKQTISSNAILRPSQRVSNIFQIFAEGGTPIITSNVSNQTNGSTTSTEQPNNNLQFHSYLSADSNGDSILNPINSNQNDYHNISNTTTNSSTTTDEINFSTTHIVNGNEQTNGTSNYRRTARHSDDSTSSTPLNNEEIQSNDNQQSNTVHKSSTFNSNNRKLLTKSTKDLQRQISTLTNVELSFENEIKSSNKQISDLFKQMREILQQREIELYLEMDQVKEQGLNIIHRRQERGAELRQRIDHCDALQQTEIDDLRTNIKQFVTDRRYDLVEHLTSLHRFEYDQTIIETLKAFGTVLRVDRKYDRSRTLSTSSTSIEQNTNLNDKIQTENTNENNQNSFTNGRIPTNDILTKTSEQPLPQRINVKSNMNGNSAGDNNNNNQNSHVSSQTNGHHQSHDDPHTYQTVNRHRQQQQRQPHQNSQYQNGNTRRIRPTGTSNTNNRRYDTKNSETATTYRRPKPTQTIVSPISN